MASTRSSHGPERSTVTYWTWAAATCCLQLFQCIDARSTSGPGPPLVLVLVLFLVLVLLLVPVPGPGPAPGPGPGSPLVLVLVRLWSCSCSCSWSLVLVPVPVPGPPLVLILVPDPVPGPGSWSWSCSLVLVLVLVLVLRPQLVKMSEELRAELQNFLQTLNIRTTCVEHPPVFTVDEMMPHLQEVSGAVTKNLFLKDKKKKGLWLVSARHDRQVNLNDLAKKLGVGSGNLRFADEAAMLEKLKVGQGCATALALLFDKDRSVKLVLDRDLVEGGHERVYFHPMTNAATMGLRPDDLLRFLKETGHDPVLESFE